MILGRPGYAPELCGIIRIATTESVISQARYCISWILLKSKLEVDRPHYGGHKITNNRNSQPQTHVAHPSADFESPATHNYPYVRVDTLFLLYGRVEEPLWQNPVSKPFRIFLSYCLPCSDEPSQLLRKNFFRAILDGSRDMMRSNFMYSLPDN